MKTLRELLKDKRFGLGAAALLMLAVLALLSFFSPYDPLLASVVPRDMPPSWEYFLGTNSMGQDVFWRLTFAVRNSLILAFFATAISRVIAVTIGLMAGYYGGIVERVLMFAGDTMLVIPAFMILILLAMLVQEHMSLLIMVLILGIIGWSWDARLIRSQILSLREREFTYTAILSATPTRKLIFNEYILFIIPLVLATSLSHLGWVVGMEVTLAILGLTDLTIPTLGAILRMALSYQAIFLGYWWWVFAPIGIAVMLFIGLYLLSVSVSVYLDPRARMQRVGVR